MVIKSFIDNGVFNLIFLISLIVVSWVFCNVNIINVK